MKAIIRLIWLVEILGLAYVLGGIRLHSLFVAETSQLYFHNWAVGVVIGTYLLVLIGLLALMRKDPGKAAKQAVKLFPPTLVLLLMGLILSSGQFGGSFLKPNHFGFVIPIGLAIMAGIGFGKRAHDH